MENTDLILERWKAAAAGQQDSVPRAPISVLVGEALELSCFVAERWEPVEGPDPAPGMCSAAEAGALPAAIVTDLRELALAVAQAHAHFQACTLPVFVAPVERGKELLAELRHCLSFLFADGVEDGRDASLERLTESHSDTSSHDALALSLEGFSLFAHEHREDLARLPGFDPAIFDEALRVAMRLREQSAFQLTNDALRKRRDALALRNRLVTLLRAQLSDTRRTVRFVFRHHPEIATLAGSTYDRQRLARSRARRKRRDEAPSKAAPTDDAQPPSNDAE